jgi:hypothetical protein
MLTYGLLVKAVVIVIGIWWCKEIFGRLRDDIDELKTCDNIRRGVIIFMWLVTIIILIALIGVAISLVMNIIVIFR